MSVTISCQYDERNSRLSFVSVYKPTEITPIAKKLEIIIMSILICVGTRIRPQMSALIPCHLCTALWRLTLGRLFSLMLNFCCLL